MPNSRPATADSPSVFDGSGLIGSGFDFPVSRIVIVATPELSARPCSCLIRSSSTSIPLAFRLTSSSNCSYSTSVALSFCVIDRSAANRGLDLLDVGVRLCGGRADQRQAGHRVVLPRLHHVVLCPVQRQLRPAHLLGRRSPDVLQLVQVHLVLLVHVRRLGRRQRRELVAQPALVDERPQRGQVAGIGGVRLGQAGAQVVVAELGAAQLRVQANQLVRHHPGAGDGAQVEVGVLLHHLQHPRLVLVVFRVAAVILLLHDGDDLGGTLLALGVLVVDVRLDDAVDDRGRVLRVARVHGDVDQVALLRRQRAHVRLEEPDRVRGPPQDARVGDARHLEGAVQDRRGRDELALREQVRGGVQRLREVVRRPDPRRGGLLDVDGRHAAVDLRLVHQVDAAQRQRDHREREDDRLPAPDGTQDVGGRRLARATTSAAAPVCLDLPRGATRDGQS